MLQRRQLLSAAALLVVAPDARDLPFWQMLEHRSDFAALGRAVVGAHGDVYAALSERIGMAADGPAHAVMAAVMRRVAQDFAAQDVVNIDGWVVSRTEVVVGWLAAEGYAPSNPSLRA
jgi:hypothetical protein